MHVFDDRSSTLIIYTTKKPSRTSCRKAPSILMTPACGFPFSLCQADDENFLRQTRELGYLVTIGHAFFKQGKITCSDPQRQVSPGLLYYCLIGQGADHVGADPNNPIYDPLISNQYQVLDYHPSPNDLLWKPYRLTLGLDHTLFEFMAPNPYDPTATPLLASILFEKLAFRFEFNIMYPAANEQENYVCYWSPIDYPYGTRAPFHVHYELIFNTGAVATGIAHRTADYRAYPGIRSPKPINNIRIYNRAISFPD